MAEMNFTVGVSYEDVEEAYKRVTDLESELSDLQTKYKEFFNLSPDASKIVTWFKEFQFAIAASKKQIYDENGNNVSDQKIAEVGNLLSQIETTKKALLEEKSNLTEMTKSLQDSVSWSERMHSAIAVISTPVKSAKESFKEFRTDVKLAFNSLTEGARNVNEIRHALTENEKQLKTLQAEYDKLQEKPIINPQTQKRINELSAQIDTLKESISGTRKELEEEGKDSASGFIAKASGDVKDFMTRNGKFQESLGNLKTAIGDMGGPLTGMVSGFMEAGKAMWALCKTPLGMVLTAIVLAMQAMWQWMNRSAEGQVALAKLTGYLSSVFETLMDIVVELGGFLFHCFSDANGSMHDFAKGMVTTFKKAIMAVADLFGGLKDIIVGGFEGLQTGDFSKMAKGWDMLKKGISETADTIVSSVKTSISGMIGSVKTVGALFSDEKLGKNIGEIWRNAPKRASEAANISAKTLKLEQEISANKQKQAEEQAAIAEKQQEIYKLQGKDRLRAIRELKELQTKSMEDEIAFQKRKVQLVKDEIGLHVTNLQGYRKLHDEEAKLVQLKAQQIAMTRIASRLEASTQRSIEAKNENAKKARASADELIYSNEKARIQEEKALEARIADARIKAIESNGARVIAERKRQQEKELEELDKQKTAAIEKEYNRQKAEFQAEQSIAKANGGKARAWDKSMFNANDPAVKKIEELYGTLTEQVIQRHRNEDREDMEQRLQSLYDYLMEYGDFQEQKEATSLSYNYRIDKAKTEGEKESLRAEKKKKLEDVETNASLSAIMSQPLAVRAGVSLDGLSDEDKIGLKKRLQDAADAMKELPTEKLQEIYSLIQSINADLAESNPFLIIKEGNEELENANQEVKDAQEELSNAIAELKKLRSSGADTKKLQSAQEKVTKATNKLTNATQKQVNADNKVKNAKKGVAAAVNALGQAMSDAGSVMDQLGMKGAGAVQALGSLVSSIGSAMQLSSSQAVGAIKSIESASVILAIISAAIQLATQAADLLGLSKDDSQYEAAKAEYEALINTWDTIIDRKKEYLDISWGDEAKAVANEIDNLIGNKTEAAQENARKRAGAGASAGSHSYGYRMNRDLNGYFNELGIKDIYDLTFMTGKQLEDIQEKSAKFWSNLDGDFREYLEDIIKYGQEAEDIQKQLDEQMAGFSFDSMYDEFVDTLMDMDADAETFGENLSETMMKALLSNQVGMMLRGNLQKWYDKYMKAMKEANGKLSKEQVDYFKSEYDSIVQEGLKLRDSLAEVAGMDDFSSSEASGSMNAAKAMTEDTANELIGRITAVQLVAERIATQDLSIYAAENMMLANIQASMDAYLAETREVQAHNIGMLEGIQNILATSYIELTGIRENTSAIIEPIQKMSDEISTMRSKIEIL